MQGFDTHGLLYTTAQVRDLDRAAIERGTTGIELMERAAHAALEALRQRWPDARELCVVCGPGNNGGDGFLLAALARAAGLRVHAVALAGPAAGDAANARARWEAEGGQVLSPAHELPAADVYVDALFGSGLHRALTGDAARWVAWLNAQRHPVLALDVPSGLDADTGLGFDPCVRAMLTVCFIAWKRGLFTGHGVECAGERILATLDGPDQVRAPAPADAELLSALALSARPRDSHKGRFGHVGVIGGEHGMGGAVRLCGEAAARVGAGLVSVATRAEHVAALLAARPELMVNAVADAGALQAMLTRAEVLALGPGLGQGDWGRALWQAALDANRPTVLDADGLNLLARRPRGLPDVCVLTPHPGEAARLLGGTTAAINADRFAAARALAARFDSMVVLKGSGSLIADPAGRVAVCPWGNPGMASGGMGDVLTGVIAALLAQGLDAWAAACLGVGLHARAGDLAAREGERGLLASDLFVHLRALVNDRRARG